MRRNDKQEKKAAIDEYRQAKAELDRISRRDGYESDDYLTANQRVAEAAEHVPWYRR
ncbi:hypothetical protein SAMN04487905_111154 [Actinopolyspora xinjiangensis]|uniref:Uncharacterized protein n=1 Tax=Actinopolyspora xinjiangensis TaxID=405564 RepID=A0A1H0WBQ5_9ACTN|nr:hypothetical protein [Actinopolyspora xinjiangensis]SDP87971.1 hypothetical protein SAMN04487905_111154 [Actinopolyspora xinjiangensis]